MEDQMVDLKYTSLSLTFTCTSKSGIFQLTFLSTEEGLLRCFVFSSVFFYTYVTNIFVYYRPINP